jgi:hypothetical protein
MRRQTMAAILKGGGLAGAIDITYAIGFSYLRGVSPMRILQSVASGLLGSAAYEGGGSTAALGLALHFLNALIIAAIFVLASRRVTFLTRRAVLSGIVYGFLVYWVMNLVVLPLSAFPGRVRFAPLVTSTGLLVHMFGIGLPIALAARRASSAPADAPQRAGR